MAALDRIMCPAVTGIEFVVGQMGCEVDASWHAPVLQQLAATPYHSSWPKSAGTGSDASKGDICLDNRSLY